MATRLWLWLLVFSALSLAGCEQEGPAERAGEQLDEAAQEMQDSIENACEDLKEGVNAEDTDC